MSSRGFSITICMIRSRSRANENPFARLPDRVSGHGSVLRSVRRSATGPDGAAWNRVRGSGSTPLGKERLQNFLLRSPYARTGPTAESADATLSGFRSS